jgi:hypothetical protein
VFVNIHAISAPTAVNSGSILRSEQAAHPGVQPRILRLEGGVMMAKANPSLATDAVPDLEIVP